MKRGKNPSSKGGRKTGFYFRCPYCRRIVLSSNPEDYRHILVLKEGGSGLLICPKFWNNHDKPVSFRIKEFDRVEEKEALEELRKERE